MSSPRHYPWLDWLRFLAALLVMATHARSVWPEYAALDAGSKNAVVFACFAVTRLGLESVVLFFVMSGMLVGGRALERAREGSFSLRDYALDRVTRIYVPLIPALIYTAIVMASIGEPGAVKDFVSNTLSVQGAWGSSFAQNGALWSLSYEVWLYVLMGAAVAWWQSQRIAALLVVGLSLALLYCFGGILPSCWIVGALAGLMLGRRWSVQTGVLAVVMVLVGTACSVLAAESKSSLLQTLSAYVPDRNYAIMMLATGLSILLPWLAQDQPTGAAATLERWGTRLAAWSYTLYLTHSPTLHLMDHLWPYHSTSVNAVSVGVYVLRLAAGCGVAWLLAWLFEARTAAVRRWLRARICKVESPARLR